MNYGGNEKPEFLTCLHEETAVAMAHGYAKIEGKPLIVLAHGTVGLQHASMAIYNAWCDRVPVYLILGNTLDATMRYPGVEWVHSVQDAAAMVRDYTKWDDTPISLQHFAESAVRAYKVSMTPLGRPRRAGGGRRAAGAAARRAARRAASPEADARRAAAGRLRRRRRSWRSCWSAPEPRVRRRSRRSLAGRHGALVELAELLQAAVISTQPNSMPPIGAGRMNFPSRHPLNQTLRAAAAIAEGDVVVGLEIANFFGATNIYRDQIERSSVRPPRRARSWSRSPPASCSTKANYQDFQRYSEVDLALAARCRGDAAVADRSGAAADRRRSRRAIAARGVRLAEAGRAARERARADATYAWDAIADQHRTRGGGSVGAGPRTKTGRSSTAR